MGSTAVRQKPHSREAERAVLGALFIDNSKIREVMDVLPDGKQFYSEQYGKVYDAMLALHRKSVAIDEVTLADMLRQMGVPPEVADEQFIIELVTSTPTAVNALHYANRVAEKALLRDLLRAMEGIGDECYQCEDVSALLEKTEKDIFTIVQRRSVGELTPTQKIVMESLNQIDQASRMKGDITGLATGFLDLDHLTAGFREGQLVLVAARPAMGKTSFVLSILENVTVKQKKPALMFSLEMSETELMNRLLSMNSHVDSQKFKKGELTDAEWELLAESGGMMAQAPVYLSDRVTTVGEISSIARKYRAEKKIELVVIDYLQLMNSSSTRRSDSRQQEISDISRGLKLLAKELGIPIIALSQLSRGVESRTDHRPQLSDLRESGAIEQDADIVIFIYRDEVYNSDSEKKGIAEILVKKNRSGPTGDIELVWLPQFTQFNNKEYR
ncbi:MAG: replicative DNA helicase [Lachnospiraceae bacterium]|nr:replicative DNA helicase [Lachnospiraceae bacterium]